MNAPLKKIELKDLADFKRQMDGETNLTDDSGDPVAYYKLQKQLGFVGATGGPIGTNNVVTIWFARTPLTDGTEDLSDTVLPIIDKRWDDVMTLGACYNITMDPKWKLLYESELMRIKTLQDAQIDRVYQIPVDREYD